MVGTGGRETVTVEFWDVPSPAHYTDINNAISLMMSKREAAIARGAHAVGDITVEARDGEIRVKYSIALTLPGGVDA